MLELLIAVVAAFFLGYYLGRREGRQLGITQGQTVAPLLLRQQSYEQGHCLLCQEKLVAETGRLLGE